MKALSVTILLICLIAATFSQWLLIVSFDINENYIAKELCVNRNNPHSGCNGHCYLNKQLATEEKQDNPLTNFKEKFDIQLFCVGIPGSIEILSSLIKVHYSQSQNFFQQEVINTAFHPPGLA